MTDAVPISEILVRLDELQPKVCAVVRRIEAEDDSMDRLKALGICIGRQVELVKRGDPLIVRVFGSRLGISSRLANRVLVEPCTGGYGCADGATS